MSSSSRCRSTTSRWPSSGISASATSRSTQSRPGRRCCSRRARRDRLAPPRDSRSSRRSWTGSRSRTRRSSLVYALIPQDWLGGDATARGVLYGLRHDLTPVAAYFLGRGLRSAARDRERLGWAILGVAGVVAAWGLVDIYAVSLQTWRDSGVPGWFGEQLGLDYGPGLSGLPENWVYNPGDERPLRRLVSTFLSPLATAYLLLVAILLARDLAALALAARR